MSNKRSKWSDLIKKDKLYQKVDLYELFDQIRIQIKQFRRDDCFRFQEFGSNSDQNKIRI